MANIAPAEEFIPTSSEEPPDSAEYLTREQGATVETLMQDFNGILQADMSANPPGYHYRAMEWWKTYAREQIPAAAIVAAVNQRIQAVCIEIALLS